MTTLKFLRVAFTDVHQTTHEAAILCVKTAQTSGHWATNMMQNTEKSAYIPENSNLINTTYAVEYWPTQTAKDNNALPLDLRSSQQQIQYSFTRTDSNIALNDVDAALEHLQNVLLPGIDENAVIEVL